MLILLSMRILVQVMMCLSSSMEKRELIILNKRIANISHLN